MFDMFYPENIMIQIGSGAQKVFWHPYGTYKFQPSQSQRREKGKYISQSLSLTIIQLFAVDVIKWHVRSLSTNETL